MLLSAARPRVVAPALVARRRQAHPVEDVDLSADTRPLRAGHGVVQPVPIGRVEDVQVEPVASVASHVGARHVASLPGPDRVRAFEGQEMPDPAVADVAALVLRDLGDIIEVGRGGNDVGLAGDEHGPAGPAILEVVRVLGMDPEEPALGDVGVLLRVLRAPQQDLSEISLA